LYFLAGLKSLWLKFSVFDLQTRALISNDSEASLMDSAPKTTPKRRCGEGVVLEAERSLLEALPQDVLVSTKFLSFNLRVF
jgi:hypothetical protein